MAELIYRSLGNKIKSARESAGLSQEQLAQQMGFASSATVSHFESGSRKISIADLHKLSRILGIPLEFFISEVENGEMQHFRLRAKQIRPSEREIVASFLAFASRNSTKPLILPKHIKSVRAGEAANYLINELQINTPPISPFKIAEQLRIPVFQWDFPNEISGIFVSNDENSCIGVNQNHPYVRQRFTVSHELGHFIFHNTKNMFVDFLDMDIMDIAMNEEERKLEMQANWFAADLLMPRDWMYRDFKEYGENNLKLVAQKYEVSEQALWIRWVRLKLVNTSETDI